MSGIVGIFNRDGAPVDRDLLGDMVDFMRYRGPDAQAAWSDGHVGFGHTMLCTTHESVREHQPLSLDGRVWITADARVDGRNELVAKLAGMGLDSLNTATDPELILRSYLAWNERCVDHLIGDYAFAIWDGRNRRLFCARDHFGVKPLFYACVGKTLIFGNTLECLRLHPGVSDELNDVAIGDFLLFGTNQDPATTAFADIRRLPGSHWLTCSEGALQTKRYWSLPTDGHVRYRRASDYVEHFREHLRTAVDDRLRTDRVCCEMSGGLDSPSVAATAKAILAQRGTPFELSAHTIVYDRLIPDQERHFSGLVARALDIPIRYLVADDYALFEPAQDAQRREPEPFHVYPRAAASTESLRRIAARGRVVLTGWDGDTLLCESPRLYFRALLRQREFRQLAADMGWFVRARRALPPIGVRTWIKRALGKYPLRSTYPSWIDPSFASRIGLRERWQEINAERPPAHPTRPLAAHMLSVPNWWWILESYDPGVTRLALEARHPLLDLRLVNYVLAIPPVPWCVDKHILREAMTTVLPDAVVRRPKSPLAADPVLEHLRAKGTRELEDAVPSAALRRYAGAIPAGRFADATDANVVWLDLRPWCLGRWLAQQPSAALARNGCVRGRMVRRDSRGDAVQYG